MHLMGTPLAEIEEELAMEVDAPLRLPFHLHHPSTDAFRIELLIPRHVERVREIDTPTVAAHLDHLRSAVQRGLRIARMWRAAYDAADVHRAGQLRLEWIRNIVLPELARAPTGDI